LSNGSKLAETKIIPRLHLLGIFLAISKPLLSGKLRPRRTSAVNYLPGTDRHPLTSDSMDIKFNVGNKSLHNIDDYGDIIKYQNSMGH
jgi:hypothetical protein